MLLGCIADDFTGATDLANMLVRGGMRTVQTIGIGDEPVRDADAIVVALKSRTAAPAEAVRESLEALRWLRAQGCRQIYFKYCSTFDSTPEGNIGPVTDALMDALGCDFTIACPAFPENGRTVYQSKLFVGDVLLNESGMKDHPLTPMTDANLVRVLQPQTRRRVGAVRYADIRQGGAHVRDRLAVLRGDGVGIAVLDAIDDGDLDTIAAACADLPLVTAGSGVGLGLARHLRAQGVLRHAAEAATLPAVHGPAAILSGSCSVRTNEQVAHWCASRPALRIDSLRLAAGEPVVAEALAWARERIGREPVLIYATSKPEEVKAVQAKLGVERAGHMIEAALATLARELVDMGVRRLVAAGGETSGAVVKALDVRALRIGMQIDPGVPWTSTPGEDPIAIALKSGNFGSVDFFTKALAQLEGAA
jgi:uncharacterized protein YgbK (DUF1537 family)